MRKFNKFLVLFFVLTLTLGITSLAFAQNEVDENFNPEYIISDAEILNYNSMTLEEIQEFLAVKGSYLAGYTVTNPETGAIETAAEVIYGRCQANKISPRFILVLLQKEQSLVEDSAPTTGQLNAATGYGCPDSGGCNQRWQGFWRQVNSATLQFYDYMTNPGDYNYKKGGTYVFQNKYSTTIDGMVTVTPFNVGTAALYNYTPHVYNGNYNFYRIWKRYFSRSYPDGSLLQIKGEKKVYLIQNGKKREFTSMAVLISRFDENKIISVEKADLDKFGTSTPIKFANYSLIRSPRGTVFLLVDDKRRGIVSSEVFKKLGYNKAEITDASWEDINTYAEGAHLSATSTYPTGALLQDEKTGGVYWVNEGKKAPLQDRALLTYKFRNKKIIRATAKELDQYPTTDPVLFGDGELLKSASSPAVYLIEGGAKRPFMSMDLFTRLGYKTSNIITVSPQFLANYGNGEVIKENNF